jgi:hypothetical protein
VIRLRSWVETNKNDGTPLAVRRLADLELSGGRLKGESAGGLASREAGFSVICSALDAPVGELTENPTL